MQFRSFIAMATASSLAVAGTMPGFEPSTEEQLMVSYGAWTAEGGNNIPKSATQTAPTVGTASKLTGLSYAVIMVDMDIPTGDPSGATDTLLHWIATDMKPATEATAFKSSSSSESTWWTLASSDTTTSSSPSVPYIGPNPPAQRPLTHRYAQFLLDTSDASSAAAVAQVASNAMANGRLGFDPMQALIDAGGRLAAANWYTVTNPGVGGGWGSGNGTVGMAPSATGVTPPQATGSTPAQVPVGGAPGVKGENGRVAALAMSIFGVAGVFLTL